MLCCARKKIRCIQVSAIFSDTIGRRRDDETRPKTLKEAFDFVNFQRLSELSEIPAMGPEDIDESLAILEAQLKALFEAMAEPNPKYEGEQGETGQILNLFDFLLGPTTTQVNSN